MKKQINIVLIVLMIFILVSIVTTYILIKNNIKKEYKENDYNNEEIKNYEEGIDLYGMYNENDLLINDRFETYSGEEIIIPQIEGLKNKYLEDKINKEIYNECFELINNIEVVDNFTNNNSKYYETYYDVMANFSNVISINFIVYSNEYENIDRIFLNYNLVTGERLKFEELFLSDADVIGILRKSFLERMSNDNYWENVVEGDYIASFDENELYKVVKNFMENDEKEFMFSPSTVYINFKNYGTLFEMIDYADDIGIYTKFLTNESIYEKNDIGRKNIFTLVENNYDIFENIEYGYLEDNLWYDITLNKSYLADNSIASDKLEKFKLLKNDIYEEAYTKTYEYKEIAKNNPNKFYMIFTKPVLQIYINEVYDENNGWTYTFSNMAITRIYTRLYEMPLEVYENTYKDKLIEAYRYKYFAMSDGAQIISESGDGAIYKEDIDERLYDYMNEIRITKLSDIFYEDSDYESIIKDRVRNLLLYNYDTDKDVEELVNNIKYELVGSQIIVTIPELEDFKINIIYDEFPKEMIKLF